MARSGRGREVGWRGLAPSGERRQRGGQAGRRPRPAPASPVGAGRRPPHRHPVPVPRARHAGRHPRDRGRRPWPRHHPVRRLPAGRQARRRGRHLPRPGRGRGPGDRVRHRRAGTADRCPLGAASREPGGHPEPVAAGHRATGADRVRRFRDLRAGSVRPGPGHRPGADLHRVRDRRPAAGPGHRRAPGGDRRPLTGPASPNTTSTAAREAEEGTGVEQGASANLGARLAAGEEGAIEECYAALGPMVLGYLRRFVARDEAEDVLQRVFYEVWRNRDRYDPGRSLEAWVLGIARKRAIDQLRRRHPNVVPIEELRDLAGDDGRELAERYARASEVRGALARLPTEQREVLTLAYFGELTQTEIAERLAVPLGTVKARAFRGLRRLADLLGATG